MPPPDVCRYLSVVRTPGGIASRRGNRILILGYVQGIPLPIFFLIFEQQNEFFAAFSALLSAKSLLRCDTSRATSSSTPIYMRVLGSVEFRLRGVLGAAPAEFESDAFQMS